MFAPLLLSFSSNAQISGFVQPAAANFPEDLASTLAIKEIEPSATVTL